VADRVADDAEEAGLAGDHEGFGDVTNQLTTTMIAHGEPGPITPSRRSDSIVSAA